MSDIRLEAARGEAVRPHIAELAALRMAVFREWPYCYEGCEDYEREYLASYANSPTALVVLAYAGGRTVGASTALRLDEAPDALSKPVRRAGLAPEETLYAGESVLLPSWRGRGVGVAFFEAREAHARALGLNQVVFCRVVRPPNDPRRPADVAELDAFWRNRGYAPMPGVTAELAWKEVGMADETTKTMEFWIKRPV